jgi:LysR family transcriptional activator of glutamate synthase operon
MNTEDMRRFVAVAELSNITEASEALQVPQPTLSRSIARLEKDFGFRLFDRIGRNIRINDHGRLVEEHVRRALTELDSAQEKVGAAREPDRGLVRIGHLFSVAQWLVPPLIRDFRHTRPHVNFSFRQDRPQVLELGLREHTLDVAIISPKPTDRALAWAPLHREWLHLTVRADHPLAGRRSVYLREAEGEDVLMQYHTTSVRALLSELAARADCTIDIKFRTDSLSSVRGLVVAGMGVTFSTLPARTNTNPPDDLVDVPVADANAFRDVGIVWNRQFPMAAATKAFIDFTIDWATDQPHGKRCRSSPDASPH